PHVFAAVQHVHPNDIIGYGAQWLWQEGGVNWPVNYTVTFESVFTSVCDGQATLHIAADN
ncbi:hypothetical protein, partial [Streptococcus pneumoniae]|uniref:hypothetical protein n=1 Tax=Streptococcus pneumoniae TaxID=1313 RepID=UPI0018B05467